MGLLKYIWKRKQTRAAGKSGGCPRVAIVLPSYDELTRFVSVMITDEAVGSHSLLRGDECTVVGVRAEAARKSRGAVALVFVGHGFGEGLLAAPNCGGREYVDRIGGLHGVLIEEAELVAMRDVRIFAYCCSAGAWFGPAVARAGGQFLGFRDEIPFVLTADRTQINGIFVEPVLGVLRFLEERCELDGVTEIGVIQLYRALRERLAEQGGRDAYQRGVRMALWMAESLLVSYR